MGYPKNTVPMDEKRKRLGELDERKFREDVVRTLFLSLGYRNPRENHGPDELGKDIIFIEEDKLKQQRMIAVQTKKGKINMAVNPASNAANLVCQLQTAADTPVHVPGEKAKRKPDEVILCASGTINKHAQDYIDRELQGHSIRFLDIEDMIPLIDEHCPEVWKGMTADVFVYYDAIKKRVESFDPDDVITTHVTDDSYTALKLYRHTADNKKRQKLPFDELTEKELINKKEDVFIQADAGTGKSTLLWRLSYLIARNPEPNPKILPLLIQASEMSGHISGMDAFIEFCGEVSKNLSGEILIRKETFEQSRVMLLVDAIDEIPEQETREKILQFLMQEFKPQYPSTRFICTSRPGETIKDDEFFNFSYSIEPLSVNQAKKIVARSLRSNKKHLARSDEELLLRHADRTLSRIREIHGFELTPLLVTIFACTAEYENRDIPANVTELFKKFTEIMLERWDEKKGMKFQFHYEIKDFLLKKIAFAMHTENKTAMPMDDFNAMIGKELAERGYTTDTLQLCGEIIQRSRLVRKIDGKISFSHHLLQEFFAGRGIDNISRAAKHLKSPWWTKCFVFYFGDNPDKADELSKLQGKSGTSLPKNKAIGLSLQACFLSCKDVRLKIWKSLIESIEQQINDDDLPNSLFPIFSFFHINEYIKDALALHLLGSDFSLDEFWPEWGATSLRRYLVLTAFRESGLINKILERKKSDLMFSETYCNLAFYSYIWLEKNKWRNKRVKPLLEEIEKKYTKDIVLFREEIESIMGGKRKNAQRRPE